MKKTLNESTVRRFMKLAHIDGLTENFVTSTVQEGDTDTTYEENMDLDVEEEVPDLEGDLPLDLDPETVETIVDAVVSAIGDVTNTDTSVTSTDGPVGDLEDDALEDEAEAVFDGEQAAAVGRDEIEADLDDELVDGDLEEGHEGVPSKTRKGHFDYDKGPTAGSDVFEEDKPYTAKKEKAGADKRKGAEKRGAEGTLAKTPGHGRVDYVNEEDAFLSEITRRVAARLMSLTEEE